MAWLDGQSQLVLLVLVFVAVLLFMEGLYVLWQARWGSHARKLNRRLDSVAGLRGQQARTSVLRQRMADDFPVLEKLFARIPRAHALEQFIAQSGLALSVARLGLFSVAAGLLAWAGLAQAWPTTLLLSLLLSIAAGCLPMAYVAYLRSRRLRKLQHQLPEALDLMTRSLRAGHAFSSSLKMAGEELPDPIATELRLVHDEVNYGVSLAQALTHLGERVPLTDVRYFVVAVLIQRESGGNLTEILANLSRLVRERLKLLSRIRVLSSEGRLSAWVLGVMPFALAGLLTIFNPEFISRLWTDPIGIAIVQTMLTLMAIGILILIKIVKIRV
jgi:tight adherence protein B